MATRTLSEVAEALMWLAMGHEHTIRLGGIRTICRKELAELHADLMDHVRALERPNLAWPVGSVFITATDTDPATLVGFGTWAPIAGAPLHLFFWKRTG